MRSIVLLLSKTILYIFLIMSHKLKVIHYILQEIVITGLDIRFCVVNKYKVSRSSKLCGDKCKKQ